MTAYEVLDHIADSVNPVLLLVAITLLIRMVWLRQPGCVAWAVILTVNVAAVYLFRFFDHRYDIWRLWGGDYSTHYAFAVAVGGAMGLLGRKIKISAQGVVVGYGLLILYQHYHSLLDLVSSAGVQYGVLLAMRMLLAKRLGPLGNFPQGGRSK